MQIRPQPKFSDPVTRLQQKLAAERSHREVPTEEGLYLRANSESLFLPQTEREALGTIVLYHGYTAAPWQYPELANELHDKGYNVYAPRMPGHGMADAKGKRSSKTIPQMWGEKEWKGFAQETFDDAKSLGVPVHAVGLSGGANVALAVGKQNPELDSITALAPFLGSDGATGFLLPTLNLFHNVTFGLFGGLLDRIPRKDRPDSAEMPTAQGSFGQALAMYRVGRKSEKVDVPVQVVTTAKDPLSGTRQAKRVLRSNGNRESDGWYHFPASDGVPHAMVSPLENPNREAVEKVGQIIVDFIAHDKPTNQKP